MSQTTQEAPLVERPSQVNDSTIARNAKEELAFDALTCGLRRTGLVATGDKPTISSPIFKSLLRECVDALAEAGLLRPSFAEAVRNIDPLARVQVWVQPGWDSATWESIPRPREQAKAIADVVLAEFGGEVVEKPLDTATACFKVRVPGPTEDAEYAEYMVFYGPDPKRVNEEACPHGTTTT